MRYTILPGDIMPLLLFFYISALILHYLITDRAFSRVQYGVLTLFFVYTMGVLFIVFLPIRVRLGEYAPQAAWDSTLNLMLFARVGRASFILNVWLMVPLGVLLPLLRPQIRSVLRLAGYAFSISLSIEVLQFLMWVGLGSRRVSDVNDLIANTLGAVLGYLLCRGLALIPPVHSLLEKSKLPTAV